MITWRKVQSKAPSSFYVQSHKSKTMLYPFIFLILLARVDECTRSNERLSSKGYVHCFAHLLQSASTLMSALHIQLYSMEKTADVNSDSSPARVFADLRAPILIPSCSWTSSATSLSAFTLQILNTPKQEAFVCALAVLWLMNAGQPG